MILLETQPASEQGLWGLEKLLAVILNPKHLVELLATERMRLGGNREAVKPVSNTAALPHDERAGSHRLNPALLIILQPAIQHFAIACGRGQVVSAQPSRRIGQGIIE